MAKENFAQIIGPIRGAVQFSPDGSAAQWQQTAMRRSGKTDFVPIIGYDEVAEKLRKHGQQGQWLISKGILTTRNVVKRVKCPSCGSNIDTPSSLTEILAIDVAAFTPGPGLELTDFKEMSNMIMLLGTVCSPQITVDALEGGVTRTRYQVAVNRKFNAKRQPNIRTDYPTIYSFARQAEDDREHLQTGSQCYITGGVQVCNITRTVECTCREESGRYRQFPMGDMAVDVVTHSVEYLNNCKF